MSYCVHCGVELADSERRCPLCGTEVLNPRAPWREPAERPYPSSLETVMRRIDRRYVALLIGVFLLIPVCVSLLCNLLTQHAVTWSGYVAGACALLYIWCALPLFFAAPRWPLLLGADFAAAALYLLLIERMTGGRWFLPLGLPIAAIAAAAVIGLAVFFRRRAGRPLLVRTAAVLAAGGLACLLLEVCVDLYADGAVRFSWSPYALTPCLVLAAALLTLEHRKAFKEELRKRLFY